MTARLRLVRRSSGAWYWALDVETGHVAVLATGSASSSAGTIEQAAELCRLLGVDAQPAAVRPSRQAAALSVGPERVRPLAPLGDTGGRVAVVSSLWWMQPGWTATRCDCGARIWPEGDPDWGACLGCFSDRLDQEAQMRAQYEADMREGREHDGYPDTAEGQRG